MNNKLTLLVVSTNDTNYFDVLEQVRQEGHPIFNKYQVQVEQAGFDEMELINYHDSGLLVDLFPSPRPFSNTNQSTNRVVKPNFVMIRNVVHGPRDLDHKNILYGFMHANVGCINSLEAVYSCLQRPIVHAELKKIQDRLGADQFPLVPQNYYSDCRELNFVPPYPIVLKVSHVHAGQGKMKVDDDKQLQDIKSIIAVHGKDYCTAETYLSGQFDLRIQKIGNHYRVVRRYNAHGWKGNVGTAIAEDIPMTDRYKLWADEASKMFGGLDILAVDVLVEEETGKEYILEVNDCSIGLIPQHFEEDYKIMMRLTLDKMLAKFTNEPQTNEQQQVQSDTSVEAINLRNDLMECQKELNALNAQKTELERRYNYLYSYTRQLKIDLWKQTGLLSTGILVASGIVAFIAKTYTFRKSK